MTAFAVLLGLSGFLQLGFLTFLSPIVWFYSFFHANNLNSLNDEEFYSIEDDYLLHWNDIIRNRNTIRKYQKLMAACLIFFGVSILWNIISGIFWHLMPNLHLSEAALDFFVFIERSIPQLVVACCYHPIRFLSSSRESTMSCMRKIVTFLFPQYIEQNGEGN